MTKRMLECNVCGEPLAAADDDELLSELRRHVEAEHSASGFDESVARHQVASDAYDAGDS